VSHIRDLQSRKGNRGDTHFYREHESAACGTTKDLGPNDRAIHVSHIREALITKGNRGDTNSDRNVNGSGM
jgi:hypothetical protein